jgi:pyruvate carboxylase
VRTFYSPFEPQIRSGTSDVYRHEMPGGQYTNLREQARSMGLEHRWNEVAQAYADVNQLFGDIVKVTPSSKVVGDMALFMVANELSASDVMAPDRDLTFPDSVVSLMRGEVGYPADGFPKDLQTRVLKGLTPIEGRVGAHLPPANLEVERAAAEKAAGHQITDTDLASYLMYPKVFVEYADHLRRYGDVSVLPTPVFFYGLDERDEMAVDIDKGKTLVVRLTGKTEVDDEGEVRLFFELNGQARPIRIGKLGMASAKKVHPSAEEGNPNHVAAPMPGNVSTVAVKAGQKIKKGDPLVSIEAMKMEMVIAADRDATIAKVLVAPGDRVDSKNLLVVLED